MGLLENIFKNNQSNHNGPPERIRLTISNISQWTTFEKTLKENKIKFDRNGRLRYLHGAPVGDLILTKMKKDGTPIYKESASEWFDPESKKSQEFVWP